MDLINKQDKSSLKESGERCTHQFPLLPWKHLIIIESTDSFKRKRELCLRYLI